MKKILVAAALIGTVGLAGAHIVQADNGYGPGPGSGCGNCPSSRAADRAPVNIENSEAFDKFQSETVDIRRDIVVKQSTLAALMRQENPDENKVATLTGELYDLQNKLDVKAKEVGVERNVYPQGPGMMWSGGRGRGRHMMDW